MLKILLPLFFLSSVAFANDVLSQLKEGNQRFRDQKLEHCMNAKEAREESAIVQKPIAAIVACSDSRVPPDMIFDQKLGSLFVIRLAGNLVDDFAFGSLEYAVKVLGVKYIVVLGHSRCGVIEAFLGQLKHKESAEGHIEELLLAVYPAVPNLKEVDSLTTDDLIKANVLYNVKKLQTTPPILSDYFLNQGLEIVGGVYDLDTGAVEFYKADIK